ncbi:MAG: hypothetical protein R3F61_13310 [Myxococcota bacterium]
MWWTVLLTVAQAADPEADRIAESLVQSVREGEWRAVERRYTELVKAHPSGLSGPIHQTASQAARMRGDLLLAAQRLLRVRADGEGYDRAHADLKILEQSTGLVMVWAEPTATDAALTPTAVPFAPDMKLAIENASAKLQSDGVFVGLLPTGEYTLGSRTFTVSPGFDWHVVQ